VIAIFFATYLTAATCKDREAIKSVLDCYTNVSNLFLVERGGDSLFYFKILNFSFSMTKNNENASKANNSILTGTPGRESANPREQQLDFSSFNSYFTDVIDPCKFIEYMQEVRSAYLKMSLYVLMEYDSRAPMKMLPHDDVQEHICQLTDLIDLAKSLRP
jgi:hypothetical protein